jgi:hypothetical protein
MDHDTASFAVATIRRWWFAIGKAIYSEVRELMITVDERGSNGSRIRLSKLALQRLADKFASIRLA